MFLGFSDIRCACFLFKLRTTNLEPIIFPIMDDLFKKFLYTSVGLASLTAEKLQEAVDDLVGRGKLSENEGKKILDDFFSNTDAKKEEFEAKLREAAESTMERFSLPSKEDITALQKRIGDLEKQIELMRSEQNAGNPPKK